MYVVGVGAVLLAAIMLKKTKYFHGPAAPFVMELPQYHIPQLKTVLLHTWERLWSFIKKAGTILFLACIVMWFLSSYGFGSAKEEVLAEDGSVEQEAREAGFGLVDSDESLLAVVGNGVRYIFVPLGFGNKDGGWQAAAASISGFSAKEAIVSTMGVLAYVDDETAEAALEEEEAQATVSEAISAWFPTALAAFAFLLFNLLDSPCLAAIATMANELNSRKWFWFAIAFQNVFAYVITLIVFQIGTLITTGAFSIWTVVAFALVALIIFGLVRKNPYKNLDRPYSSKAAVAA